MAKKSSRFEHNPGMMLFITYLVLLVVSELTVSVAANMFPESVVLGTASISRNWALLLSMGALSLLNTFAVPFVREWEHRAKRMLSDGGWMALYLILNFVGLWVISRYSEQFGLGLSSWMVVLGLAIALDFVQGAAMMLVEKWRTQK